MEKTKQTFGQPNVILNYSLERPEFIFPEIILQGSFLSPTFLKIFYVQ